MQDYYAVIYGDCHNSILWGFLLQRAIEGVNRDSHMMVDCMFDQIKIYNPNAYHDKHTQYFMIDEYSFLDEAKEASLNYIYNQEKTNDN